MKPTRYIELEDIYELLEITSKIQRYDLLEINGLYYPAQRIAAWLQPWNVEVEQQENGNIFVSWKLKRHKGEATFYPIHMYESGKAEWEVPSKVLEKLRQKASAEMRDDIPTKVKKPRRPSQIYIVKSIKGERDD